MNPIELDTPPALTREDVERLQAATVGMPVVELQIDGAIFVFLCQYAKRYLKLRDGNVVACYTVPPKKGQPGVRISGQALDQELDK